MIILTGVFCAATFADWRHYRIPNACILTGMLSGLIMTFVSYSVYGIAEALVTMTAVFMAFYPFYLMGGIGAGDVKLLMMVCCFVRGQRYIDYILVTFAIAAAVCAAKMALYKKSRQRLSYLGGYIRKAALTGSIDNYITDKKDKRCVVRLSIPAFASLILMILGVY